MNPFEDWNIDFSKDRIKVFHTCGREAKRFPYWISRTSKFMCMACGTPVPFVLEAGLPDYVGQYNIQFYSFWNNRTNFYII